MPKKKGASTTAARYAKQKLTRNDSISSRESTSESEESDSSASISESGSEEEEEDDSESSSSSSSTPPPPKRGSKGTKRKSEEDDEGESKQQQRAKPKSVSKKKSSRNNVTLMEIDEGDEATNEEEENEEEESKESSGSARKRRKTVSGPMDPDELPDEWRCSANDALTFRLVRSAPEKETSKTSDQIEIYNFHPTYTHQLWDDEEIVGYKRVKAVVQFTSGALYTHIKVEYEEKYADTDVPDIQSLIASKLRGGYSLDLEDFKSHVHDPFVPPGELLCEYTVPSVDLSFKEIVTYEVYRGRFDDPTMRVYHQRLQFFLLFFIDRSSYINDADLVWEIILLFQKRVCLAKNVTTYHIVGYTTLYKFLSYPSDWKMRLSQILILPPFQRAGHGQKLLQLVYQEAEKRNMIEVNIEDPSPVFQMLRDLTDITLCKKGRFFEKQPGQDFDPLEKWNPIYAAVVKAALRITMSQVRRCYEIFRLNSISDRHKSSKAMTAYRLEVKARIFREEQEVLSLYSQKPELRKEKLAEIYNELEAHYAIVIKKARLH